MILIFLIKNTGMIFIDKAKKSICVFQVSALKKTRYGQSALSFYFIKIFYIEIAFFHYISSYLSAYLTMFPCNLQ